MKTLFFLALLGFGCWFLHGWLKKQSTPEKILKDPMVRYTNSLRNDVKKAEEVRDKANAAIEREVKSIQKAAAAEETPAQ